MQNLQELVSKKDQPKLRADRSKFEPQVDFVPASAFAAAFKRSTIFADMRAILDKPFDKARSHPAALMKSMYGIPGWDHVKALTWRERILLTRNKSGQLYRYIQMAVLSIMLATLFVRGEVVDNDSVRVRPNLTLCIVHLQNAHLGFAPFVAACNLLSSYSSDRWLAEVERKLCG